MDERGTDQAQHDELPEALLEPLRSAAQSLADQLGGDAAAAERAVFESARELTRGATVLQFAPLLAARRARTRLRAPVARDPEGVNRSDT